MGAATSINIRHMRVRQLHGSSRSRQWRHQRRGISRAAAATPRSRRAQHQQPRTIASAWQTPLSWHNAVAPAMTLLHTLPIPRHAGLCRLHYHRSAYCTLPLSTGRTCLSLCTNFYLLRIERRSRGRKAEEKSTRHAQETPATAPSHTATPPPSPPACKLSTAPPS